MTETAPFLTADDIGKAMEELERFWESLNWSGDSDLESFLAEKGLTDARNAATLLVSQLDDIIIQLKIINEIERAIDLKHLRDEIILAIDEWSD